MGPIGPRGLGPWALWAPGALGLGPKLKQKQAIFLKDHDSDQDVNIMFLLYMIHSLF